MEEQLRKLLTIAIVGLFLAGLLFVVLYFVITPKENWLLFAAFGCIILSGLFVGAKSILR